MLDGVLCGLCKAAGVCQRRGRGVRAGRAENKPTGGSIAHNAHVILREPKAGCKFAGIKKGVSKIERNKPPKS